MIDIIIIIMVFSFCLLHRLRCVRTNGDSRLTTTTILYGLAAALAHTLSAPVTLVRRTRILFAHGCCRNAYRIYQVTFRLPQALYSKWSASVAVIYL